MHGARRLISTTRAILLNRNRLKLDRRARAVTLRSGVQYFGEIWHASGAKFVDGLLVPLCVALIGSASAQQKTASPQPAAAASDGGVPMRADGPEIVAGPRWEVRLRRHLGPHERAELEMIYTFPDLASQMLDHTRRAWLQAGWPVAKQVFDTIARSQLKGWADDDSVMACDLAWAEVYKTLRAQPEQCRMVLIGGVDTVHEPAATDAIRTTNATCNAESESGFRNRTKKINPFTLDSYAWLKMQQSAFDRPEPLSPQESAAIDAPERADAVTACEAQLKMTRNLRSQGLQTYGAFGREGYRLDALNDMVAEMQAPSRRRPPAPPDFICPAPGTRFLLSTRGPDGRPVLHTVLGRLDYDCRIVSSVSGDRGMLLNRGIPFWADDHPARPTDNWLRALWPFAINKSSHYSYHPAIGDGWEEEQKVTGYGPFKFDGAEIQAYEVTQTVSINDGQRLYKTMNYWSPALGCLLGQRTTVFRGGWPNDVSPDWHIVKVFPPGKTSPL